MAERTYTEADLARILAVALERYVTESVHAPRVYRISEVAQMTGMSQRSILDDCRAGRVEHVHRGDLRGMTAPQIKQLVDNYVEGGDPAAARSATATDAVQMSRRNADRTGKRRAA